MAYIPQNRTFKLEGFAEFEQQLQQLADDFKRGDLVARNTFTPAAKAAMEPVLQAARAGAQVGSKPRNEANPVHMRDTIRIDARRPNGADKKSEHVRDTDAVIAVVSAKKSAVSLANEFGTSRMPAYPFLRPALQTQADAVLSILKSELGARIPEYAAKLARKKNRK